MRAATSDAIRQEAARLFPGGVNSPVRAYRAVGGEPPIIDRGRAGHVWDADGREYVDWVGAFGPLILGHAHPAVVAALEGAIARGGPFGATTEAEVRLGRLITQAMPAVERLRFVSSGTEAAMSALRVARAATGRDLVLKFAGGYHGHSDSLLAKAGSGLATLGLPASAGVPAGTEPSRTKRSRPAGVLTTSTRAVSESTRNVCGTPIGTTAVAPDSSSKRSSAA